METRVEKATRQTETKMDRQNRVKNQMVNLSIDGNRRVLRQLAMMVFENPKKNNLLIISVTEWILHAGKLSAKFETFFFMRFTRE